MQGIQLSDYYYSLDKATKKRYAQKISLFQGADPYKLKKAEFECGEIFPDFRYPDLYHYLVHTSSFVTEDEIKNYKSLGAYKYFVDGWVVETTWKFFGNTFLLMGRVKHSYSLNETPLKPWVAVRNDGRVEYGHCTCMAGLAESCSHIGALLYWLETAARIKNETSCTSKPNSWMAPSAMPEPCQHVPYVTLDELQDVALSRKKNISWKDKDYAKISEQTPTQQELQELYKDLEGAINSKPAILSLIPGYSDRFIQSSDHLPPLLIDLYDPSNVSLDYVQLLAKTDKLGGEALTASQVKHLEETTRGQASNHLWFKYRAGRITASQLYQVSHTNPHQPALSLLRKICYPEAFKFSSVATSYGCEHEEIARAKYKEEMSTQHTDLEIKPCGLFLDEVTPHLGASPDGLVKCGCCGEGVLEIKCPWCAKDASSLEDVAEKQHNFYLQKCGSAGLTLSNEHPYYMQCQLQMHVTKRSYCDFVVWHEAGVHIERIVPDSDRLLPALKKAGQFFKLCILPEVAGKWFTRTHVPQSSVPMSDEEDSGTWCFCGESKGGDMVGCDNKSCNIKWFHTSCLKMENVPSGKWLCPTCHLNKNLKKKN